MKNNKDMNELEYKNYIELEERIRVLESKNLEIREILAEIDSWRDRQNDKWTQRNYED